MDYDWHLQVLEARPLPSWQRPSTCIRTAPTLLQRLVRLLRR